MKQKESVPERFANHKASLKNTRITLQSMIDLAIENKGEIIITDMDLSPVINTEYSSFQVSQIKGDCVYGKDENEIKCVLIKDLNTDVVCEIVELLINMKILI